VRRGLRSRLVSPGASVSLKRAGAWHRWHTLASARVLRRLSQARISRDGRAGWRHEARTPAASASAMHALSPARA
jgi:hypothetical protein